ncbi:MAG: ATP-binding protein, partial [Pseudomonadales bacterium]|nr:ATP-binding protein [Pseudomonadales bacterium]
MMTLKVTLTHAKYRNPALEIHRDNPLICALPEKIESGRLRQLLTSVPQIISSNELNKSDRIHMTRQLRKAVIPTMPYVEFNNALYEIIVAGYEQRNPLDPKVIQWSYEIANPDIDIKLLVNSNQTTVNSNDTTTENLYVTGLSGVGKTKLKNAVLSLIFPTVVLHSREDFDETQIVYLCIDMPHDGSRVTLLHNLIEAIDKSLVGIEKTNYLATVKPKSGRGASIGALQTFLYSLCA